MSMSSFKRRLERIDPGVHHRIKGLRLVTAYGIAALMGALYGSSRGLVGGASLSFLAGGFALWASVSEGRASRPESTRDLTLLCAAAVIGAGLTAGLTPILLRTGHAVPELTLVLGAFLVSYLKRFGLLAGGMGSQFFIGQLLAYAMALTPADFPVVVAAGLMAALASIIPRLLSGPAEQPDPSAPTVEVVPYARLSPEFVMGLQAAAAALLIVMLNAAFGLPQSVWAMAACTYVVTGTAAGTFRRIRMRVIGTAIGLPLGLACLPVAEHAPLLIWAAAALAMIIYAMSMPARYDIACGAYTFTLVVTLMVSGEHSLALLSARLWETLVGGALGLLAARFIFPLRERPVA
ncbi:MAG TPA: FUSC family protein [Variovorax sp.]|jgi:hypothetical protein